MFAFSLAKQPFIVDVQESEVIEYSISYGVGETRSKDEVETLRASSLVIRMWLRQQPSPAPPLHLGSDVSSMAHPVIAGKIKELVQEFVRK